MSEPRHLERLLLEHLPAAVVVGDARNAIVYANRAAVDLYGCAVGLPLPRELALAVSSREEWSGDVSFLGRRVHCRATPLYGTGGQVAGSITVSFERTRGATSKRSLAEVGSRISSARAAAGLTQEELAGRLGVSRRSVQGYEAGRVAPYRHLDRLATVLGRPRAWFLCEADAPDADVLQEVRRIVREEIAAPR
jgi:DNA-binding XRE family transcriptional regulator